MDKEKWIYSWTHGKWSNSDPDVIRFIANILYHTPTEKGSGAIYELFASGYCYYFARMLQSAFGRGDVCWHVGFSHIVWRDVSGIPYDIGGVFYDYDGDDDLIPVEQMGKTKLAGFLHVPGKALIA